MFSLDFGFTLFNSSFTFCMTGFELALISAPSLSSVHLKEIRKRKCGKKFRDVLFRCRNKGSEHLIPQRQGLFLTLPRKCVLKMWERFGATIFPDKKARKWKVGNGKTDAVKFSDRTSLKNPSMRRFLNCAGLLHTGQSHLGFRSFIMRKRFASKHWRWSQVLGRHG